MAELTFSGLLVTESLEACNTCPLSVMLLLPLRKGAHARTMIVVYSAVGTGNFCHKGVIWVMVSAAKELERGVFVYIWFFGGM
jgi:hypothetical protein